MTNWQSYILSQYAASPTILAVIESCNEAIDPANDITNFYNNIFNIQTASGAGLDQWGQILGVQRNLAIASSTYFGFKESTTGQPFNQAPFYNGVQATSNYPMTDKQFRQVLTVKAAANISNLSIASINALLRAQFGTNNGVDPYGAAYVQNGVKSFNYYLAFTPSAAQIAIITSSGVFPRPTGIQANLVHL